MDKHLTCVATYPKPLRGSFSGGDVTILATGDYEGLSPVFQVIDSQGRVSWQPIDKVTISLTGDLDVSRERAALRS